ncbi:MAG: copper chaperone PCu(A)C [Thermomicrobiales bacterium]
MLRVAAVLVLSLCLIWDWAPSGAAEPATPVGIAGEMPGDVPVALTIRNTGGEYDSLLGATSPIADRIDLHHTRVANGLREMDLIADGIAIPPDATVTLELGSTHLMLIGLREPLVQGRTFPLTLHFARAGEVTVTVRVRRKLDAAGITPFPPVAAGDLQISLASAPPAPGPRGTPAAGSG